jgi:hypothetical protein
MTKSFNFNLTPTEFWKAKNKKGAVEMRVGGIATTEGMDREDERVVQDGLNFKPFLQHGFFNDDHRPGSVVGWPETARLVKKGDKLPSGRRAERRGWWVDGYLLDNDRGREIWEDAHALKRQKAPRCFGMSVEGKIRSRVGSTIAQADVHEVAITKKPVNTETRLEVLAKSMEAGHTDPANDPEAATGAPLRRESLEGAPKVKVAACKTKADWMKAQEASGLEKADFEKKLSSYEDGKYMSAYKKAMEEDYEEEDEEKARKSLEIEALEADIASLEADLVKSETDGGSPFDDDLFDDEDIRELEQVDVSGFIKSMTDASRHGFRQVTAGNEATRRMLEIQGKLSLRLAKSLVASQKAQLELTSEVRELRKSLSELGSSPAMRRGATNVTQAEAIARFQKGEGEAPKGYVRADAYSVGAAFKKSMEAAEASEDKGRLDQLSMAVIKWNQAKNKGAQVIPQHMADLIGYQPPQA